MNSKLFEARLTEYLGKVREPLTRLLFDPRVGELAGGSEDS